MLLSKKFLITTSLILCLLSAGIQTSQALTFTEVVNLIQAPDINLPTGVTNPKGNIGFILANLFWGTGDGVKNGKIKPQYIDYSGISAWTQSGSDIVQYATGNVFISNNLGIGTTSPAYKLDVAGAIRTNNQFISTVTTGTSPLSISSTTAVTNLNTDYLDGQHGSYYAPIASPALTGTPTAPTAAVATNTTQIATTAFVKSQGYLSSYSETDPLWNTASGSYYTKTNLQTSGQSQLHFNNLTNVPLATETTTGIVMLDNSTGSTSTNRAPTAGIIKTIWDTLMALINTKIGGSGLDSYIPKFSGTSNIIPSQIYDDGSNVGVGTNSPTSKLTAAGIIESTYGGFKFPDGSLQTTASVPTFDGLMPTGIISTFDTDVPREGWTYINYFNEIEDVNSKAWTTKAPMTTARAYAASGEVGGKIYVIGGYKATTPYAMNTNEAYDPVTDTWSTKAPMPTARYYASSSVANGIIYVIGGYTTVNVNTNEAYDPVTDSWTTKAPMITARRLLAAGMVNNKIYAIGGYTTTYVKNNEEYDTITNTWTGKLAMTTARYYLTIGVAANKIYAIGGYSTAALNKNEMYDPATNLWTTKTVMPTARYYATIGVVNDIIYVIGGSAYLGNVESYDYTTNMWTKGQIMPTKRRGAAGGVIGNKIYIIGGYNGTVLKTNEEFDTTVKQWNPKAPGITARYGGVSSVVNGILYVIGGYTTVNVNINEAYDPVTDTWTTKTPMITARRLMMSTEADGTIYVIGGYNTTKNEMYDPETDSWTGKTVIPAAFYNSAIGYIGGKIYVIGGLKYNTTTLVNDYYSTNYEYDTISNTWTTRTAAPSTIQGAFYGVIKDKMYIAGGLLSAGVYNNVTYEYDPAIDNWTQNRKGISKPRYYGVSAVVKDKLYAIGGTDGTITGFAEKYDPDKDVWVVKNPMPTVRYYAMCGVIDDKIYVVGGTNGVVLKTNEVFNPVDFNTYLYYFKKN